MLAFKGGTALRMVYKGNRYSEDLDFNGPADVSLLKELWAGVLSGLWDFGILAEIRNEWQSDVGYSFDVNYQGPVYDGRDRTKGKVRVDINLRPEEIRLQRELISSEYDDLPAFVLTVISQEHLMAEKVRALLVRSKPRDAYDLWLLAAQGVQLDPALVSRKLDMYNIPLTKASLDEALEKAQANWKRDLGPLLPQFVAWEDAISHLTILFNMLIP